MISSEDFHDLIGHHTLLYGETDTQKTLYTAKFIEFLLEKEMIDPLNISILDFAPKLKFIEGKKIGGRITDYYNNIQDCNNITFEGDFVPPRLGSHNKRELYEIALENYKKTSKILNIYNKNPTAILIINDVSLYLHFGDKKLFLEAVLKCETFFGNSYYGSSIRSDFSRIFSKIERKKVKNLIKHFKYTFHTITQ